MYSEVKISEASLMAPPHLPRALLNSLYESRLAYTDDVVKKIKIYEYGIRTYVSSKKLIYEVINVTNFFTLFRALRVNFGNGVHYLEKKLSVANSFTMHSLRNNIHIGRYSV